MSAAWAPGSRPATATRRGALTSLRPVTGEGAVSERTGRIGPQRRTSVATRLALAILAVAITTIVASVAALAESVTSSADELTERRFETRASSAAADLDGYVEGLGRDLVLLGQSPVLGDVAAAFSAAYDELQSAGDADEEADAALAAFYLDDFIPALQDVRGEPVDPLDVAPDENAAARTLQAAYIAQSPFEGAERRLLTDPGDGSAWSDVHRDAHPSLREIADRLDFEDLMLVDAESGAIVYSVAKDVAFATSLAAGPYSGTSLAGLVRRVVSEPGAAPVQLADVGVYTPAGDAPTAFLATPVEVDGDLVAVLVGSISFDEVTRIMSTVWREGRAGETGEMYMVGPDRRMRTDARLMLEDPEAYLEAVDEAGVVEGVDRARMEALGTTVAFQTVDTEAVDRALDGEEGSVRAVNYLGREVVSSFMPLGENGWVLVAEQEVAEADAEATGYVRGILVVTVVFVVALTFAAVGWANGFMAPVRAMSRALARIRHGEDTVEVPVLGAREFRMLGQRLDGMVQALRSRREAVIRALQAKATIIRTLMPETAAARVGLGERNLVDTVPQASIVAVAVDGLDDVVEARDATASRAVLHDLVDRLDRLAEDHGLERVRFSNHVYYAAAGLSGLLVDHAPRAASFASAAVEEVASVGDDGGVSLGGRAGVSSGSVTAGLVGTTGLVFDLWGHPVEAASALAQSAEPSQVLLDDVAHERVADDGGSVRVEVPTGTAWTYRGRVVEERRP